jgi:flagellin
MGLVINDNVASLTAQFSLSQTLNSLNKSLQQLSTGQKINTAADNPSGMVISEQQLAQIAGLQSALNNTSNATSLVQTASGALNEVNNLLIQIRSLAVDAANSGFNDANNVAADQAEVANALTTITNIANQTQFGTKVLLNGSSGQTGTADNPSVTFLSAPAGVSGTYAVNVTTAATRANLEAGTAQTGALAANETLTINGVAINLTAGETQAQVVQTINQFTGQTGVIAQVDSLTGDTQLYTTQFGTASAINVISNVAASATSSGFGTTAATAAGKDVVGTIGGNAATGVGNVLTGTAGATTGISVAIGLAAGSSTTTAVDSDANTQLANLTVSDNSLVFQLGANANQTSSISIGNVAASALGLNTGTQFANLSQVNVTTQSGAQATIQVVDAAISTITALQGQLGAFQAITLQSTTNDLQATLQNTTSAEANIRDTDFAQATANYTQQSVLAQAGTAVVSNANQSDQLVQSLLQHL